MLKAAEDTADFRVIVRRAFARKIRQECYAPGCLECAAKLGVERMRGCANYAGKPVERARGRQDDAHLVPCVGKCVAERVYGTFRLWLVGTIGGKQHAGCAE
ncbi:hypothetical protein D9M68_989620 [compost metagenome]